MHADPALSHTPEHPAPSQAQTTALTIRPHSGLSGDMLVTGLGVLCLEKLKIDPECGKATQWLNEQAGKILAALSASVELTRAYINGIGGWQARIKLPHVHEHRTLADILKILDASDLAPAARETAGACFELVAQCESRVHGIPVSKVHFHEVGALDSILDIGLTCSLFHMLAPGEFICGALPMADGAIQCAHGILPAPAPAVLEMLKGVTIRPFGGPAEAGELVTPTALALLKTLGATYGAWPEFVPQHTVIAYGTRVFPDAPNGALFALGKVPDK